MMTLGWVLFEGSHRSIFRACKFGDVPFSRAAGTQPYTIKLPMLTRREIHYLESFLPVSESGFAEELQKCFEERGIPIDSANEFLDVYRYYPTFLEVTF